MKRARTVLICLDDNRYNCLLILKEFLENFYKLDDFVVILTVLDYTSIEQQLNYNADDIPSTSELCKKLTREIREIILANHKVCREVLQKNGIPDKNINSILSEVDDDVGSAICTESTTLNCDVIVMGKCRKGVTGRYFLGTNSTYVVQNCSKGTIFINLPTVTPN